jgi:hypothetical protein
MSLKAYPVVEIYEKLRKKWERSVKKRRGKRWRGSRIVLGLV